MTFSSTFNCKSLVVAKIFKLGRILVGPPAIRLSSWSVCKEHYNHDIHTCAPSKLLELTIGNDAGTKHAVVCHDLNSFWV